MRMRTFSRCWLSFGNYPLSLPFFPALVRVPACLVILARLGSSARAGPSHRAFRCAQGYGCGLPVVFREVCIQPREMASQHLRRFS